MSDLWVKASPFADGGIRLAFGGVFTVLLLSACIIDIIWRRLPNLLVLGLAIGGLAYSWVAAGSWIGITKAFAGLAIGFLIWIVFHVGGVLGAGDVKFGAAIGAWLGPSGIWKASLIAAVVGGLIALAMLHRERRTRDAFARILVSLSTRSLGGLAPDVVSSTGTDAERIAFRRRPMPYGVALAAGALIAAWFPGLL